MKTRIYKKSLLLTPHVFFLIGFFYYLIVPPVFYGLVYTENLLGEVFPIYDESSFNLEYYLDCLVVALFFWAGYFSVKNIKVISSSIINTNSSALKILFWVLCLLSLFIIIEFGDSFFQGYRKFDVFALGLINSITLLVTSILILLSEKTYYKLGYVYWVFLVVVLMLSGSRNIAISVSIGLVLFFALKNSISILNLVLFGLIILFCTICVGIFRLGFSFDLSGLIIHLFADSFFISASSMCALEQGRDYIPIDYSFLGLFVAWIPSVFFESKYELLSQLGLHSGASCSPFGGAGLVGQLYSNFGYFYFLYVFFIGVYYGYIYKLFIRKGGVYTSIYLLSLPLLMFHFYNQNIYAYLKILLFNVLILPIFMSSLYSSAKLSSQSDTYD